MDPLSITTSVITLVDATTKVYRFLQSIRHADSGYSALCMELHSLAGLLQSISRTFDDCRRHTFALAAIDEAVWDQSRLAIADCQQTIDDLTALVGRIGGLARNRSILRRTRIATQMHLHSGEAASFRDKVHVSTLSLQTLLQIINVSLSLRSNNSHDTTLRELRRLKRDLETSDGVARDIDCYSVDRFDKRLLRNLESLLSAARDFHSSASSKAGTIYGGGVARHNTEPEVDHTSTDSVSVPMVTPEKQRQMEVFVQHQGYLSRSKSPVPSNAIISAGMGKLAQKAIREFDFAKSEDVLKHALARYKMTGPEDDRHSRLRTQHALCGLLLGKQSALEDSVLDLAEYRGTKRTVADQLLFALALSYMHTLNFPKAQQICKLVGSNSSRSTRSAYPGKLDILKLFYVSYRLSGEDLLADAIEEQHPELSLQESLPTAGTFVAGCPELLGELFGTLNEPQMPSLVRGFWDFCGTTQKTPLELRLAQYETDSVNNSALGSDLHISSGNTPAPEGDKSIGEELGRQGSERLMHLKRLIHRVSLTRGAAPVTLPAKKVRNARARTFYNGTNHNHAPDKAPIKEDIGDEPAFRYLARTGATRRVLSLVRGWATSPVPKKE
ncbi:hypothetical protein PG993_011575 [Apiospora rasikravindrae]|uniref:Fungal N-terminal domain-containing protein n=1 Tax=Apiospora rasikravindrae TaxID=990691 RepID=A0ABR1S281_9PEZI